MNEEELLRTLERLQSAIQGTMSLIRMGVVKVSDTPNKDRMQVEDALRTALQTQAKQFMIADFIIFDLAEQGYGN